MAKQKIYLQKNDRLDKKGELNEKLPYFTLKLVPENDGDDWVELGVFWKAKSGNGYSGLLEDDIKMLKVEKEQGITDLAKNSHPNDPD